MGMGLCIALSVWSTRKKSIKLYWDMATSDLEGCAEELELYCISRKNDE